MNPIELSFKPVTYGSIPLRTGADERTAGAREYDQYDPVAGAQVSDAIAGSLHALGRRLDAGGVALAAPTRGGLSGEQSDALLMHLATVGQVAGLEQHATITALMQDTASAALGWGGHGTPFELQPTLLPAMAGQARVAVLPGGERVALPTQKELEAASGVFEQTPALAEAHDRLTRMGEQERLLEFQDSSNSAYLLLIIAMLMTLMASQREQGAEMLKFAERSVVAMGKAGVDAATARRTGAIIGFVAVVAIGAAGVGLGVSAARSSIKSIGHNQKAAMDANARAASRHVNGLKMDNTKGTTQSAAQKGVQDSQTDMARAEQLQAAHAKVMYRSSAIQQGGMAVGNSAQNAAQITNTEFDVRAAEQMAVQEKARHNAETERKVGENAAQSSAKTEESIRMSMQRYMEQQRALYETLGAVARKNG